MNKRKLNTVFRIIQTAAKLDYAITNADAYGDCNTCVNSMLCDMFGVESKGIWTKHWTKGMNAGGPWKDLDNVYIGHDITEEQAKIIVKILESYGYNVHPKEYDPNKCFVISEVRQVEFRTLADHDVFAIGKDKFVKRPFKDGYNAFNLDTGNPIWIKGDTLCVK